MNNNLEIVVLTKKDLKEAITLNMYWNNAFEAPFSKNKAQWLIDNNRSEDNDTLAVLAYENHTVVSFVCLVPDLIKKEDGQNKKVFWSLRWWIANAYKDTILSTYTKLMSSNAVNNQVIIKFFGEDTEAYYKKQAYTRFSKRTRCIIIFNLNYDLLVYKMSSLKKVAPILKALDRLSYKIIALLNKLKIKKRIKNLSIDTISSIDEKTWSFMEKFCKNDIVPKTIEYVNWQIDNNQYLNYSENTGKPGYECLLSSISKKIYNLSFVVKKQDEIIGFISGNVREDRFVVRYFLCDNDNFNHCLDALIDRFMEAKCKLLQTENGALGEAVKKRYMTIYTDTRDLHSLVHNDIGETFQNTDINDQDGYFF